MENAGRAAADVLLTRVSGPSRSFVVVGGVGQNGGDAWVVARHLVARGHRVACFVVGDRSRVSGDAAVVLGALEAHGIVVRDATPEELRSALGSADAIVDGIFGTGLSREVEGVERAAIESVVRAARPVLALDLPSGVDADTGEVLGVAVRATWTVTFAAVKRGLTQYPARDHAGEIVVVDLGVPAPPLGVACELEVDDRSRLLAPRAADAHKGTGGHVLVVAGAPGRAGAAALVGRGAMRAGAGWVTVATRHGAREAVERFMPELMTLELPEAAEAAARLAVRELESRAVGVVGPGFGVDEGARLTVERIVLDATTPLVVDADALTAFERRASLLARARGPRVLTPHPLEAARLLGVTTPEVQRDRYGAAMQLARETGAIVVLKGAGTIVARAEGTPRLAVCTRGTPALGVAGTGDVLAGMIAASIVRDALFEGACAAVLGHALSGERAARGADRGLLAHEVADALLGLDVSVR